MGPPAGVQGRGGRVPAGKNLEAEVGWGVGDGGWRRGVGDGDGD